ncbi:hypothetical protein GW17_00034978 [Ensete ventricosum]|nr:hypothetical protein GW17_00034978 [Ensete ventricosum]
MGGTSGFGSGSRLLEWWSSGRAEVFQLGSAADSYKQIGSGRCKSLYSGCCRSSVPGNPVALVAYPVVVRFHHARRPCVSGSWKMTQRRGDRIAACRWVVVAAAIIISVVVGLRGGGVLMNESFQVRDGVSERNKV